MAELSQEFNVHPNQISDWRSQLLDRAASVFGGGEAQAEPGVDLKALHTKIGQQGVIAESLPNRTLRKKPSFISRLHKRSLRNSRSAYEKSRAWVL